MQGTCRTNDNVSWQRIPLAAPVHPRQDYRCIHFYCRHIDLPRGYRLSRCRRAIVALLCAPSMIFNHALAMFFLARAVGVGVPTLIPIGATSLFPGNNEGLRLSLLRNPLLLRVVVLTKGAFSDFGVTSRNGRHLYQRTLSTCIQESRRSFPLFVSLHRVSTDLEISNLFVGPGDRRHH